MNDAQIAVSVIVPVYNAEPYIERCIESLRGQTLRNMEFIFVDDCGQDGSMAIVERHAAEDGRIRILRNERNLGAGPSRNAGMAAARGEYLGFVDPDDWIAADFYELLHAKAKSGDFGIVKGRMAEARPDASGEGMVIVPDDLNERMAKHLGRGRALYVVFDSQHWAALYRRALVEAGGARYGSAWPYEDSVFQLQVCRAAQSSAHPFAFENRALYYYFQRGTSIMHTYSEKRYNGGLDSLAEMFDFLVAHAQDGPEIYRFAEVKLQYYMKTQRYAFPLHPELRDYAKQHQRRVREQALRLPDRFLLMRQGREMPLFLLFGINIYAVEAACKRAFRSIFRRRKHPARPAPFTR